MFFGFSFKKLSSKSGTLSLCILMLTPPGDCREVRISFLLTQMPFSLLALFTNLKINGKPINLLGASRRGDWRDAGMWGISDVHCSLFMGSVQQSSAMSLTTLKCSF